MKFEPQLCGWCISANASPEDRNLCPQRGAMSKRSHHGNTMDWLKLVFINCSLCDDKGLEGRGESSCKVLTFLNRWKMAEEKLGTFQRIGRQYELKMQNLWFSLLIQIKGFDMAEVVFRVTGVKMQRLHIQLELFIWCSSEPLTWGNLGIKFTN